MKLLFGIPILFVILGFIWGGASLFIPLPIDEVCFLRPDNMLSDFDISNCIPHYDSLFDNLFRLGFELFNTLLALLVLPKFIGMWAAGRCSGDGFGCMLHFLAKGIPVTLLSGAILGGIIGFGLLSLGYIGKTRGRI